MSGLASAAAGTLRYQIQSVGAAVSDYFLIVVLPSSTTPSFRSSFFLLTQTQSLYHQSRHIEVFADPHPLATRL